MRLIHWLWKRFPVCMLMLLLACFIIGSGCRRIDDGAQTSLELTPSAQAMKEAEREAEEPENAAKPRPAQDLSEKKVAQTKNPDTSKILDSAERYICRLIVSGKALQAVKVGSTVLTLTDTSSGDIGMVLGRRYERIGSSSSSGLDVWSSGDETAEAKPQPLRRGALKPGESIFVVGRAGLRPLFFETKVAATANIKGKAAKLNSAERFTILGLPQNPSMALSVGLDYEGRLAAVILPASAGGYMQALPPQELAVLAGPRKEMVARLDLSANAIDKVSPPVARKKTDGKLWLGMQVQSMNDELAKSFDLPEGKSGVLVTKVHGDSPASKAGFAEGDILLSLSGVTLKELADLLPIMAKAEAEKKLAASVFRDGKFLEFSLVPVIRAD